MLNKTMKFEDIITFTRNSAATYWDKDGVLQTAAIDEPRFDHDPLTGEPLGILCEGQATNLVQNSMAVTSRTDIDTSLAGDNRVTHAIKAEVVSTGTDEGETVFRGVGVGISGTTVRWCLLNRGNVSSVVLLHRDADDGFSLTADFDSETLSGGASVRDESLDSLGDGWFLASFVTDNDGALDDNINVKFDNPALGDYFYCGGLQIEAGETPSSYIPTNGAAATRSGDFADVASLSPWFSTQPEMTLLADWIRTPHGVNSATLMHALRKTAGITAGYFGFYSTMNGLVYTGAEPAQAISFGKGPLDFCKTGISVSGDTLVIGVNGDVRSYGGSTYSNVVNQEKLQLTANRYAGWLQNVRYYPYSISEEEMAEELS